MKRSIKRFGSLLLILSLCTVWVAASAQADPDALQITKIEVNTEGDPTLNVTLTNTGTASIDEFGLAIAFLDADGVQIYGYEATLEGYEFEVCNWFYTPEKPIEAGGKYLTNDVFASYAGTSTIAVAIRYYHIVNGDYIMIPESKWYWAFPGYETDGYPADRPYYSSPSADVYSSIEGFDLGYNYSLLDDFNAYYYGKNQGGEWITNVDAGSPADMAGLQIGDLILFVDGVKPTENMYVVEYSMSAIMNGEKVDWVYERDGYVYVTRVGKP